MISVTGIISDLNQLDKRKRVVIKRFIQDLASEAINQNKKKGEYVKEYIHTLPSNSLRSIHPSSYDLSKEYNVYKFKFLSSHGLIDYVDESTNYSYIIIVTINDIAKLLELNHILNSRPKELKKENPKISNVTFKDKHIFEFSYDSDSGDIKINGTKVHHCNIDAQNEKALLFIQNNPYRNISKEELESAGMTKTIANFLKDIKIDSIKKILFFPHTNSKNLYFRPTVILNIEDTNKPSS